MEICCWALGVGGETFQVTFFRSDFFVSRLVRFAHLDGGATASASTVVVVVVVCVPLYRSNR